MVIAKGHEAALPVSSSVLLKAPDPELEIEAVRALLAYQVDCLVSTGATDPDRISDLCAAAGVRSLNLDLPGTKAASVTSDTYSGAHRITHLILDRCRDDLGYTGPLLFIGGRIDTREHILVPCILRTPDGAAETALS